MLCGCSQPTFDNPHEFIAKPRLDRALNTALSWPSPPNVDALLGARLFEDGSHVSYPEIAITRAILRTNQRISPIAALELADATVRAARRQSLPPEFLGATILQESAYDPRALSSAGAVGLAQFMLDTASANGVDPYNPYHAIDGASRLLGGYVRNYRGVYNDEYAAALAAYNAGPGAVAYYRGIPPYAETREYIVDIYERWGRVASYETLTRSVH